MMNAHVAVPFSWQGILLVIYYNEFSMVVYAMIKSLYILRVHLTTCGMKWQIGRILVHKDICQK